jgi:hypothetical protein
MKSVCNRALSLEIKKQVLQAYIKPIFIYGSEAWTINRQMKKHIESTEMWFLRRMMGIPWTARKTNEEILIETHEQRHIIADLKKRQTQFIGHVFLKEKLEDIVTTEKLCGKQTEEENEKRYWTT